MISLRQSARGRFLRITVPLIFISVLGVFTAIEITAHRNAMAQLVQSSQALLRTQSAALANPLWNLDDAQVRLSLEAIATNREIVLVRVFGERGDVIAEAGDENALTGNELSFRQEIVFDAGTGARGIGKIEFFVTQAHIWQQTRGRLLLAAGIALRRIVGTPLERLLTAINAAKGDHTRADRGRATRRDGPGDLGLQRDAGPAGRL